jgi:hypothetical protein
MGCQFCYRYCDVDESEHQQILMGTILSELKRRRITI